MPLTTLKEKWRRDRERKVAFSAFAETIHISKEEGWDLWGAVFRPCGRGWSLQLTRVPVSTSEVSQA